MNPVTARVVDVTEVTPALCLLWFEAPEVTRLAHAGQFMMVRCGEGLDPYLARPFSFSGTRQSAGRASQHAILIDAVGRGTTWLAGRRPGDLITVLGPLGRGLTIGTNARNLLLVADGARVAPLLYLAERAVALEANVALLQGVSPGLQAFPAALLPPEVEVVQTGAGRGATAEVIGEYLRWSDQVFVSGAEPLLRQISSDLKRLVLKRSVQVVVWQPLACGTGICGGCAIETRRHGSRLLCRDGPRFELSDLY